MSCLICQVLYLRTSVLFPWQRECKGPYHHSPSTIPHAVFLPRTRLPFTWYSLSLPTTAKGIASFGQRHFNMVQCTDESCIRFMRWNKYTTCPSALTFCLEEAVRECDRDRDKLGGKEGWERGRKSWDKCVWKKEQKHLLWSCHCRSCPPCPRQTPSVGKTLSRPSPAPSLPIAQHIDSTKQHTSECCLQITLEKLWDPQPVQYGNLK